MVTSEDPVHARTGDTVRVVEVGWYLKIGTEYVVCMVDQSSGFAWSFGLAYGVPPSAYRIIKKGPRW